MQSERQVVHGILSLGELGYLLSVLCIIGSSLQYMSDRGFFIPSIRVLARVRFC